MILKYATCLLMKSFNFFKKKNYDLMMSNINIEKIKWKLTKKNQGELELFSWYKYIKLKLKY